MRNAVLTQMRSAKCEIVEELVPLAKGEVNEVSRGIGERIPSPQVALSPLTRGARYMVQ